MTNSAIFTDGLEQKERWTLRALLGVFTDIKNVSQDMPVQQMVVLAAIAAKEGQTQTELMSSHGIARTTMSRTVAILSNIGYNGKEGLGLVYFADDPTDRRTVRLHLTAKGRMFVSSLIGKF